VTILLVDQVAGFALTLADRGYVIEGGQIVGARAASEIGADGAFERAYLGAQAGEHSLRPLIDGLDRLQRKDRLDSITPAADTARRSWLSTLTGHRDATAIARARLYLSLLS
jgi:hypothetical protein